MRLEVNLNQKQQLNLSQNIILSIRMLAMNSVELDDLMVEKSQENIFLDVEEKKEEDSKILIGNYKKNPMQLNISKDDEEIEYANFIAKESSFIDYLKEEAGILKLNEKDKRALLFLIDNLDERGYLAIDISKVAKGLEMETHEIYKVLEILWTFEPKGVGARDLRENLLLQCDRNTLLYEVIDKYLVDFSENRLQKIAKKLKVDIVEVQDLKTEIKKLNPIPSSGFKTENEYTKYIRPEIFVEVLDGNLEIKIEDSYKNKLNLSEYYINLLENTEDEDTKKYLNDKYSKALFFLEAIATRRKNIRKVVNEIVDAQGDFFLYGSSLKELRLVDIAKKCGLSASTVSRISRNKYLECSRGVFLLKDFFINSASKTKVGFSKDEVISEIEDIIEKEDKYRPYSDSKIVTLLQDRGYDIKRRTVAKYREDLGIKSSSKRKLFK